MNILFTHTHIVTNIKEDFQLKMKVSTPEISWHEREPVYSCAYHPTKANVFGTAGVTGVIRVNNCGFYRL